MAKRKRAIDQAKEYREKVIAQYALVADPWTIPGLKPHPNKRILFMQMLPKQKESRLFNLLKKYTTPAYENGFVGFGFTDNCILNLPTGEKMIAVSCNRYGRTVQERDKDFSAELDFSVRVLCEFAVATGRLTAVIDTTTAPPVLNCSDGRHIPLAACAARPLAHEE